MTVTVEQIQTALIGALQSTATSRGLSPHLPGWEYNVQTLPGIAMGYQPSSRTNGRLKGGIPKREVGVFTATILTRRGIGTSEANDHAEAIAALFNEGVSIAAGTGTITIKKCDIRAGFEDETAWRVNVVIQTETAY